MKKLFLFLIFYFLFFGDLFAQWQPDVRLTNSPGDSYVNRNCLYTNGNSLHLVWYDNRDGNYEIYYKLSTNSGLNWGADTRLTYNVASSVYPSISASASMLHIVWSDDRDGNEEIYYKRSTNGGLFWGGDTRLTNSTNHLSEYPQFSVSGSFLHLVWQKLINSNWIIFYKRSTDEGTSWGADVSLSSDSITSMIPSISSSGQFVHIAWEDHQSQRLIYKRSTNGGQSWEANKFISNNLGAGSPSISVNGSIVHVVWYNGMGNIDYNRSTDGGISWGAETQLTIDSHASFMPSVSASGAFVHVTWEDLRNGGSNSEIYYKRSSNGGLNWGADTRLTNADYYSENSFVTVSGSVVHVVWIDGRTDENNAEIYYKRNPTGNTIGIKNINSDIPDKFSLSQNYPNPFNPSTIIRYKIKDSRFVTLKVYDILGKVVATLVNEKQSPGEYELPFSINQFSGYQIPSGIYFYTLRAGDYVETKKMLMIK